MKQLGMDFARDVTIPTTKKAISPEQRAVVDETQRRESNKARVLERLRQGPATTMELIAVGGARAVGRCWELRRDGYQIAVEDQGDGLYTYRLVSQERLPR